MPLMFLGFLLILGGVFVLQAGRTAGGSTGFPMRQAPLRVVSASAPAGGAPMPAPARTGKAGEFAQARLGQTITYKHPRRGGLTGNVLGTVHYTELWPRRKAPDHPG